MNPVSDYSLELQSRDQLEVVWKKDTNKAQILVAYTYISMRSSPMSRALDLMRLEMSRVNDSRMFRRVQQNK